MIRPFVPQKIRNSIPDLKFLPQGGESHEAGERSNPSFTPSPYPQFIKYMGSKAKLMNFVVDGINDVYDRGPICDLFAGAANLAGALGDQVAIVSNDIQSYSAVLASAYLVQDDNHPTISAADLLHAASSIVAENRSNLRPTPSYENISNIDTFLAVEEDSRGLMTTKFDYPYHLFVKYYSGTWWSTEQCLWIDAFRQVAEEYSGQVQHLIMSCLMHSMAYCGQGTGHYAQYRDATSESSLHDILIYRRKSLPDYFLRKWNTAAVPLLARRFLAGHRTMALDYRSCLRELPPCTVYADPPYCFVHYSRFYHAIETLALYDYPAVQEISGKQVKGRYRADRHQSPFCIRTQVRGAFEELFRGVANSGSNLVLSYSNTGMIELSELMDLALSELPSYKVWARDIAHTHMTMGRRQDRDRQVRESLLLARKN